MFRNILARRKRRPLRRCSLHRRGDCAYCLISGNSDYKCGWCRDDQMQEREKKGRADAEED